MPWVDMPEDKLKIRYVVNSGANKVYD